MPLIEFAEIGSTSDWLLADAAGRPDGVWVRADVQTAGHGRHGRAWTSLPGNLFASTLVRAQPGEGPAQQLSFVAALALAEAVAPWTGRQRLSLKWPNDLLLGGGKLAGILLQSTGDALVIGFRRQHRGRTGGHGAARRVPCQCGRRSARARRAAWRTRTHLR